MPIANPDLAAIIEDSGPQSASGNLLANDSGEALLIDLSFFTGVDVENTANGGKRIYTQYGVFEITADGSWSYEASAINDLGVGTSAQEVLAYRVIDSNGDFAESTLTVSLTGAPDIALGDFDGVYENSPSGLTLSSAPIDFSDTGAGTITVHSIVDNPYFVLDTSEVFEFGNWRLQVKAGANIDYENITADPDGVRYITVQLVVSDSNTGSTQYTLPLRVRVLDEANEPIGIFGTTGNDTLIGTTGNDGTIDGYAGNDVIDGKGGTETVFGGAGDDRIVYYANSTLNGGSDFDTLVVPLVAANGPRPTSFNLAANDFERAETVFSDVIVNGTAGRVTRKFYDTNWGLTGSAVDRIDVAGTQSYSTFTDIFNAAGVLQSRTMYYDVGSIAGGNVVTTYDYDPATNVSYTIKTTDGTANTNTWATRTAEYDTANRILTQAYVYDNGTSAEFTYLTPGDTSAYGADYYTAVNERFKNTVVAADGSSVVTTFDVVSDGAVDAYTTRTLFFNSTGLRTKLEYFNDDNTSSRYIYDTPGNTTAYIVDFWNANGLLYQSRDVNSDGSYWVKTFDVEFNDTYVETTAFYSGPGVRTKVETIFDNTTSRRITYLDDPTTSGSNQWHADLTEKSISTSFAAGLDSARTRATVTFVDNSYDSYDYSAGIIKHYGIAGNLLGQTPF